MHIFESGTMFNNDSQCLQCLTHFILFIIIVLLSKDLLSLASDFTFKYRKNNHTIIKDNAMQ